MSPRIPGNTFIPLPDPLPPRKRREGDNDTPSDTVATDDDEGIEVSPASRGRGGTRRRRPVSVHFTEPDPQAQYETVIPPASPDRATEGNFVLNPNEPVRSRGRDRPQGRGRDRQVDPVTRLEEQLGQEQQRGRELNDRVRNLVHALAASEKKCQDKDYETQYLRRALEEVNSRLSVMERAGGAPIVVQEPRQPVSAGGALGVPNRTASGDPSADALAQARRDHQERRWSAGRGNRSPRG